MGAPGKILCILVLLLHRSSQQQTFNANKTLDLPVNYTIDWMASLDNETLISEINIPGTHDTMALYGGPAAKCQSWSLEDQLKAGIRYLDLRVSGKNLKIVHGLIDQKTTFPNVLNTIKTFLSKYTSETVLVRVKPESLWTPFISKGKVAKLVEEKINKEVNKRWVAPGIPKMSEVRGKVVFVQKDDFKQGVPLYSTDKKNDYKVTNINKKEDKINAHLKEALAASKNSTVVLSYSSGTGWPKLRVWYTPKNVAKKINPWLYQHLTEQYSTTFPKPCFGVIAMDFPGVDLIQKVIEFNK